jgi:hypothetical protein
MRLPRGSKPERSQQPVVVVTLGKLSECSGQLVQRGEISDPKQLFLEGGEEALYTAVACRLARQTGDD